MTALRGKYVLHQQLTTRFGRLQLKQLNGQMTTSCLWIVMKPKSFLCFRRTSLDILYIFTKGKAIERVTTTKLLCDNKRRLGVGTTHNDDTWWGITKTVFSTSLEADRGMKIAFQELPYECALTRANINTLDVKTCLAVFRGILSPTHTLYHFRSQEGKQITSFKLQTNLTFMHSI